MSFVNAKTAAQQKASRTNAFFKIFAPGTDPEALAVPGRKAKLLRTTAVASVVFALFYRAFVSRGVAFEDLVTLWGLLKP